MKSFAIVLIMAAMFCGGKVRGAEPESAFAVSPARLSLKGKGGQSATYPFRISNQTSATYRFTVQVDDVVVKDNERVFVPGGQVEGSIAALAAFQPSELVLAPGETASVPVTFVLPVETEHRAVAVLFTAEPILAPGTKPLSRFRIGSVVDFTYSGEVKMKVSTTKIVPQSATANTVFTQELENVGEEPFIAKGVTAILGASGKLVGKTNFDEKRLLPGEHNVLRAEYPGTLAAGTYQVYCSLEYAGRTQTSTSEFSVH